MVSGNGDAAGAADDFPEQFRSYSENEKHWQARRTFILRNVPPGDGAELSPLRVDQLLSLSMVWANHLFLGCSYNKDLLDKVIEMAEGIEVEDVPHFTTRDEIMKKNQRQYPREAMLNFPYIRRSTEVEDKFEDQKTHHF